MYESFGLPGGFRFRISYYYSAASVLRKTRPVTIPSFCATIAIDFASPIGTLADRPIRTDSQKDFFSDASRTFRLNVFFFRNVTPRTASRTSGPRTLSSVRNDMLHDAFDTNGKRCVYCWRRADRRGLLMRRNEETFGRRGK